jgi:hypothetical protein
MLFLKRRNLEMTDLPTTTQKQPVRPLHIDLPVDLIADIERVARDEDLTRTAWLRRLLRKTVKAAAKEATAQT